MSTGKAGASNYGTTLAGGSSSLLTLFRKRTVIQNICSTSGGGVVNALETTIMAVERVQTVSEHLGTLA